MSAYVIPVIFLTVLALSLFKKQNPYSVFVEGSKSALELVASVFPYLITVMMAVELFRVSGLSAQVAHYAAPAMRFIGIPEELTELMILRPVSGAGSLAILDNVYATYGVDSFISRCASVIYGSSETIFYISAIYFSKSKVKNLRYAIPVALVATIIGCIVGVQVLRLTV